MTETNLVIDPSSLSFEQARQDILDYIEAKLDADKWKDFLIPGTGSTVIDLIAGLSVKLGWNSVVGRREGLMPYARQRSSLLGKAEDLGYSAARGTNVHLTLNVVPVSNITVNKFDALGTVQDVEIIAFENIAMTAGLSYDIEVVLGELKTEELTASGSELNLFQFVSNSVSDDIRIIHVDLSLVEIEVPLSNQILELLNDKYVAISNAFGAVTAMYLNEGAYNYDTGFKLRLEFVELKDVQYSASDLVLDAGGAFDETSIQTTTVLNTYTAPELTESIRINGPLYHETLNVVKGRNDYRKQALTLNAKLVDTNARDESPAVIELTYVTNDGALLSVSEKQDIVSALDSYRPFGVAPPSTTTDPDGLVDPVKVEHEMSITITLADTTVSATQIDNDVTAILATFENILQHVLDLQAIEDSIEDNDYVKIARVSFTSTPWVTGIAKVRGNFVVPTVDNGFIYECTNAVGGTTGGVEPIWPITSGDTIVDNDITWTCRDPEQVPTIIEWNEYFDITFTVILL